MKLIMPQPTLLEVFGTGATQTATELRISKADLAITGLTPSATNTAESLLAAIIVLAQASLKEVTADTNLDQSIIISDGNDALVNRNNVTYRQKNKIVEFYKPDSLSSFDPDDY